MAKVSAAYKFRTSSNNSLGSCCLDFFGMNKMELFENIIAFFNHCISAFYVCLGMTEQVVHEMNVPTVEQQNLCPPKCVMSDVLWAKP